MTECDTDIAANKADKSIEGATSPKVVVVFAVVIVSRVEINTQQKSVDSSCGVNWQQVALENRKRKY